MKVVLITGTSKGLGFSLANVYLEQGAAVIGVSRNAAAIDSEKYFHFPASVTDDDFQYLLESYLKELPISKIDIVINNAGADGSGTNLSNIDPSEVFTLVNLHCVGALRVIKGAETFLNQSKIVNVTSRLGSITQTQRGDFYRRSFSYGYRIAKCAQNMLSLCLAGDTELVGNTVISINPGLLLTDLGATDAKYTADEGARAFVQVINDASTGGVYHAFGDEALY